MRVMRWGALGLLAILPLCLAPSVAARHLDDDHVVVSRVSGSDRIQTALRVSKYVPLRGLPCMNAPGFRCQGVVIAQSGGYADALAGGPLGSLFGSPVLLSPSDKLPGTVAEVVRTRQAENAWVLGGTTALSSQVEEDLRAAGVERVIRLAGKDRFETAREIALAMKNSGLPLPGQPARVFIAAGSHPDPARGWPDALAAAALAGPRTLLLVERDRLPQATRETLVDINPVLVTIVGGTESVSESVEEELRSMDFRVDRIAGANRYETAWLAAQDAVGEDRSAARVWLATGENWPDALAAAPAVYESRGVLLLAHPLSLEGSSQVRSWVERYQGELQFIRMLGGLSAISLGVEDELRRSTEPCHPSYQEVCIGPPPPQLTCDEVGYRNFRVTGEDPHGFDPHGTGTACPAA